MWITLAFVFTSCAAYQHEHDSSNTTANDHLITLDEAFHEEENNVTQGFTSDVSYTEGHNITDLPLAILDHSSKDATFTSTVSSIENSSSIWDLKNFTNNDTLGEEYLKSSVTSDSVFNAGVIAGISAVIVVIAVLIGVIGFLACRHFSWIRPRTLKFSNDETTGYIDDLTIRENSEEMYSLDNDSFLNSLEAMTIQNYWTDQVKHTKLDQKYDSDAVKRKPDKVVTS